jgi:hypothetical protein
LSRALGRRRSKTAISDCTLSSTQIHPTPGGFCRGRCRNQNGISVKMRIRSVGAVPTSGCSADHPCDGRFGERQEQEETVDGRRRSECFLNPHQAERYTPRVSFSGQSHRSTHRRCRDDDVVGGVFRGRMLEGKTGRKWMKAKVSKIEYGAKARKKEESRVTGLYDRRTENGVC